MTDAAPFSLLKRNPDVLTCIANLSNDEVFTPPEFAQRMLDTLAEGWASANEGANIWADSRVTFLDPCTKSGVFLREIAKRLIDGLADEIPDLQARVDHILTHQVFGIGITRLTALLARRSLYCSKWANGEHSVATGFDSEDGNVWFERTEHVWEGAKCRFCGANQRDYDRGDLETHAYAFLHSDNIKSRLLEMFGDKMQFDVIIGNPPYQLGQSGGDAIGSFAMPIYQKFIEAAKALEPRFLTMVTPSRWFAGGRGLEEFRQTMLSDRRVRTLVDFPDSREVFAGVDIAGGISYFLWDAGWNDACSVTTVSERGASSKVMKRFLNAYDIHVRHNEAVPILERVLDRSSGGAFQSLASQVAPIQPFSIRTNFRGASTSAAMADPVLLYQNGGTGFIERSDIPRNVSWVDDWKVFLSGTASEHGGQTDKSGMRRVFSRILVGGPGTACTETYLVAGRFGSEIEARNFALYLRTRFVRFLVALRTNTQHLYSERFAFVPTLPMDRRWTDAELYKKYGITTEEQDYIESMIRPMDAAD